MLQKGCVRKCAWGTLIDVVQQQRNSRHTENASSEHSVIDMSFIALLFFCFHYGCLINSNVSHLRTAETKYKRRSQELNILHVYTQRTQRPTAVLLLFVDSSKYISTLSREGKHEVQLAAMSWVLLRQKVRKKSSQARTRTPIKALQKFLKLLCSCQKVHFKVDLPSYIFLWLVYAC